VSERETVRERKRRRLNVMERVRECMNGKRRRSGRGRG
jgi:hypothetical protein